MTHITDWTKPGNFSAGAGAGLRRQRRSYKSAQSLFCLEDVYGRRVRSDVYNLADWILSLMAEDDPIDEISRIEARLEELAEVAERCKIQTLELPLNIRGLLATAEKGHRSPSKTEGLQRRIEGNGLRVI